MNEPEGFWEQEGVIEYLKEAMTINDLEKLIKEVKKEYSGNCLVAVYSEDYQGELISHGGIETATEERPAFLVLFTREQFYEHNKQRYEDGKENEIILLED